MLGSPNPNELTRFRLVTDLNLNGRLAEIVDVLVSRGVGLAQARKEFERQFIVASLRQHDGNLGRSARSLGIHRNTLRNKVSNLEIDPETALGKGRKSSRRRDVST